MHAQDVDVVFLTVELDRQELAHANSRWAVIRRQPRHGPAGGVVGLHAKSSFIAGAFGARLASSHHGARL